jgi:hypothetical protein
VKPVPRWFLVLELALSGCSFTLSAPAAHRPRNQPPACDSGKGMVAVDALIATGFGIAGLAEATNNSGNAAVLPFALGAAFLGAALYGNSVTNRCRTEMTDYRMVVAPDTAVAPALTGPRPVAIAPPAIAVPPAPRIAPAPPTPARPPAPAPAPTAVVPPPAPFPTVADPWQAFWQVQP